MKRTESAIKNSAPYYVFKVNCELLSGIENDESARHEIVDRSARKPVYLLEYFKNPVFRHKIHILQIDGVHEIADADNLLKEIRQQDLLEVIRQTRGECIIDAPLGMHFVTPSKKHTTRFLRVADALHSYDALDRISYWLQPVMEKAAGVVIDSWSLSSIVLKTQQLLGRDVPFDCFRQHIKHDEESALKLLDKLQRRVSGDGSLLCLVSISSSGFFLQKLKELIAEAHIKNVPEVLSIFRFDNTPKDVEALATLDFPLEWYEESNCSYCEGTDKPSICDIDPKFYYPRQYNEEPVSFSAGLFQDKSKNKNKSSHFIHKYGQQSGVLRIHRDDPNDGLHPRHHAFYIDVVSLLENDDFKTELKSTFEEIEKKHGKPELVVTPPHPAGELLAQYAQEIWGSNHFPHHNLRNISNEQKTILMSAKHVCFLDDVFISGTRITQYLRALREEFAPEKFDKLERVTWFPLISRPTSGGVVSRIKDSLAKHSWVNDFVYLYEIILPHWVGSQDCPWCHELTVYERQISPPFDAPEWYEKRRNMLLSERRDGIINDPLFVLPNIQRCKVGQGSPIMDMGCTDMQLVFQFANGLQVLRNDKVKPLGRGVLSSYVLSMYSQGEDSSGLFHRFSEALFQAAFLRVVRVDEWDRTVKTMGVDFLLNQAVNGNHDIIIGEVILFLHRMGYDRKLSEEFSSAIKRVSDGDLVLSLVLSHHCYVG